jgi:hypothetical protein
MKVDLSIRACIACGGEPHPSEGGEYPLCEYCFDDLRCLTHYVALAHDPEYREEMLHGFGIDDPQPPPWRLFDVLTYSWSRDDTEREMSRWDLPLAPRPAAPATDQHQGPDFTQPGGPDKMMKIQRCVCDCDGSIAAGAVSITVVQGDGRLTRLDFCPFCAAEMNDLLAAEGNPSRLTDGLVVQIWELPEVLPANMWFMDIPEGLIRPLEPGDDNGE